jgi:hypothetical protein
MACVTIHHWEPVDAGLRELRRVARGPVVIFTFELDALPAWQLIWEAVCQVRSTGYSRRGGHPGRSRGRRAWRVRDARSG